MMSGAIVAAVLCFVGGANLGLAAASGSRDLTDSEAGRAMRYVYGGKTRAAIDYLDSLATLCDGEPYYLLIKSRVARELLTVDDEDKKNVTDVAQPIHRDLDRVIDTCTARLESGDDDPRLRLYRGLAWMSKSHLRSFERRFWRAGRDAKKGKSDLESYLKIEPDDPLALGTLGVFLYFADTIPSVFKYLSKLFLMPTGDREEGLKHIETAASTESVFQTDFQVVLLTVFLLFEGRYEDGLENATELLARHPGYPRLAHPLALMQPFNPIGVAANAERIDAMLDRFEGKPPGEAERYALSLLDFLNAYANRFVAPPDVAAEDLTRIADSNPEHPDWVGGYAAFELGRLLASQGRTVDAFSAFAWVRHNPRVAFLHDDAKKTVRSLRDGDGAAYALEPGWITDIYFGTADVRAETVRELDSISTVTAPTIFYRAEARLMAGDTDGALAGYRELLDADVDPWDEEFKMLAASRTAEIHGARCEYDRAADWLGVAAKYYRKEFLVDWVLEGRQRYYRRLRDGDEISAPRILAPPP
jgi:tetratricopeptide (TPR) repeat protein